MYSNCIDITAYADTVGVVLACCCRLRISLAWGRRRSHWCTGQWVAPPLMIQKKFCLKALMETSATLRQWQCSGTSLRAQYFCMRVFMLYEHLLYRMWHDRAITVCLILLRKMRYPLCISESILFFIGVTSVVLL